MAHKKAQPIPIHTRQRSSIKRVLTLCLLDVGKMTLLSILKLNLIMIKMFKRFLKGYVRVKNKLTYLNEYVCEMS